jgi:fructose-1,6-bisphosphatase/inositol monophosphatase family enzyme
VTNIDIAAVQAWAREGGAYARSAFNQVARRRKADRSWVTDADIAIETLLRERISTTYPDHGIIGEEQGAGAVEQEFVWAVDPIDGTNAFVSGLPLWCVSIGLLRFGEPYLGVIYLPLLDDCYWVDASGPAYRNDEPLTITNEATIDTSDWIAVSSYAHRQFDIRFPGKTRSLGSVAADFCYVARGSAAGALIGRANLWDIVAGVAILRAAGGTLQTLSGGQIVYRDLFDGSKLPEPILIAPPSMIETLRGYITRR